MAQKRPPGSRSYVSGAYSPPTEEAGPMWHRKDEGEESEGEESEGEDVGGIERLMCALVEAAPGPLSMSP